MVSTCLSVNTHMHTNLMYPSVYSGSCFVICNIQSDCLNGMHHHVLQGNPQGYQHCDTLGGSPVNNSRLLHRMQPLLLKSKSVCLVRSDSPETAHILQQIMQHFQTQDISQKTQ